MCQKAFGSFFGPLVTVSDLTWTRGRPKRFWSSNLVQRGFCAECGTPLTFEHPAGVELAIGAFDDPSAVPPTIQVSREGIPTGLLSIPIRYMHSTVELVATADVDRVARLLAAYIARLGRDTLAALAEEI